MTRRAAINYIRRYTITVSKALQVYNFLTEYGTRRTTIKKINAFFNI